MLIISLHLGLGDPRRFPQLVEIDEDRQPEETSEGGDPLRDARRRVQRNRRPDVLDVRIGDVEVPEVRGGGVGAADFEPLPAVVFGRAPHVVEEAGRKEDGETVGSRPGGVGVLGIGFGVEVGSEAVVEDCGWEALLHEMVGAFTHG